MKVFDKEEYYIKSVSDFLTIKNRKHFTSDIDPGTWIYRGECATNFSLKPSVGRSLNDDGGAFPTKEKLHEFEKSAFNEFRIRTYNELRENDQFMLLAVAQHHGLKTRLLDWTFSPLIALFFAVENEFKFTEDGALIAFQANFSFNDFHSFPDKVTSPFDKGLNEYHFLFMPDLSPRIRAQQGIFQMFKDPTQEFLGDSSLQKFIIPALCKKDIKRELNDLGISYRTIFPDLDGLCRDINYRKLNNKL